MPETIEEGGGGGHGSRGGRQRGGLRQYRRAVQEAMEEGGAPDVGERVGVRDNTGWRCMRPWK